MKEEEKRIIKPTPKVAPPIIKGDQPKDSKGRPLTHDSKGRPIKKQTFMGKGGQLVETFVSN